MAFISCNYSPVNLPVVSYERRKASKVIDGKCSQVHFSTGNGNLAIGKDGIRIINNKFKFQKNIKGLLVKYNFNYGDCIELGSCTFDQIVKYPIKIEVDEITKDSIEILNVKNEVIQYRKNNKLFYINKSDSLFYSNHKIDTTYIQKNNIIMDVTFSTTIKYMATLNLKTMRYIKENIKSRSALIRFNNIMRYKKRNPEDPGGDRKLK